MNEYQAALVSFALIGGFAMVMYTVEKHADDVKKWWDKK